MNAVLAPDPLLLAFVERAGLARDAGRATWTALTGGVSSDIWRVDLPERTICIKRALPRLKVVQTWEAPIERNAYEWKWITFAARHCPRNVPAPIAHDASLGIFAMGYLEPSRYPNWKRMLLDGDADPAIAAAVGAVTVRLHAASARDADVAGEFATDAIFHAIRLEPYLLATAERHPGLRMSLRALSERTAATRIALVHGDVSPKNILIGDGGPVILDAECAWFGDPAFDAAFCLNHLLLKCVARPALARDYLRCFDAFAAAYVAGISWESRDACELRVASLLPALALARIDGKSPVDYLDDAGRACVRQAAIPLIVHPVDRVETITTQWARAVAAAAPGA